MIKAVRIGHAADLRDLERFHTDFHLLDSADGRAVRRHGHDMGLGPGRKPAREGPVILLAAG